MQFPLVFRSIFLLLLVFAATIKSNEEKSDINIKVVPENVSGRSLSMIQDPRFNPQECGRENVSHSMICDPDHLLSVEFQSSIEGYLLSLRSKIDIMVVIINKMEYRDMSIGTAVEAAEYFATALQDTYQIHGVLVFLSVADRAMYFSTSENVQPALPPAVLQTIITEMRPSLQVQDYFSALKICIFSIDHYIFVSQNDLINNMRDNDMDEDQRNVTNQDYLQQVFTKDEQEKYFFNENLDDSGDGDDDNDDNDDSGSGEIATSFGWKSDKYLGHLLWGGLYSAVGYLGVRQSLLLARRFRSHFAKTGHLSTVEMPSVSVPTSMISDSSSFDSSLLSKEPIPASLADTNTTISTTEAQTDFTVLTIMKEENAKVIQKLKDIHNSMKTSKSIAKDNGQNNDRNTRTDSGSSAGSPSSSSLPPAPSPVSSIYIITNNFKESLDSDSDPSSVKPDLSQQTSPQHVSATSRATDSTVGTDSASPATSPTKSTATTTDESSKGRWTLARRILHYVAPSQDEEKTNERSRDNKPGKPSSPSAYDAHSKRISSPKTNASVLSSTVSDRAKEETKEVQRKLRDWKQEQIRKQDQAMEKKGQFGRSPAEIYRSAQHTKQVTTTTTPTTTKKKEGHGDTW